MRALKILVVILVLIAAVAAGLFYLSSNLNGFVAGIIETQGSAATQTAVKVEGIAINLPDASASMEGLSIDNPQGFAGKAIEMGGLSIALDATSLTKNAVVVNAVTVSGARVNLIQQGKRNNLKEILDSLQRLPSNEETSSGESGKRLIIDRFILDGASASVSLPDLGETREVSLPRIEVNDIGRASNGATGAQIAQQVLRPVLDSVLASAATQTMKAAAGEKINETLGGLMNRFGDKQDNDKNKTKEKPQ